MFAGFWEITLPLRLEFVDHLPPLPSGKRAVFVYQKQTHSARKRQMCMFEQVSEDISRQHRIRIEEAKLIINDLQISDNSKILEVGCGSGVQAALFAEKTSFIISSDINLANVKLKNVPLIKCSCEYLPFKGNTFDIVYSSCVLEHLKNRGLALREMKRVLKANGIMVCVVPTLV